MAYSTINEIFYQSNELYGKKKLFYAKNEKKDFVGTTYGEVLKNAENFAIALIDMGVAAGDRIGFYGVADLRLAHGPQPVALRPGELRHVSLALVAQLDEQLRPVPLTPEPGQ